MQVIANIRMLYFLALKVSSAVSCGVQTRQISSWVLVNLILDIVSRVRRFYSVHVSGMALYSMRSQKLKRYSFLSVISWMFETEPMCQKNISWRFLVFTFCSSKCDAKLYRREHLPAHYTAVVNLLPPSILSHNTTVKRGRRDYWMFKNLFYNAPLYGMTVGNRVLLPPHIQEHMTSLYQFDKRSSWITRTSFTLHHHIFLNGVLLHYKYSHHTN